MPSATWAQREIIDDRVTMEVIEAKRRGDSAALSAIVRGNFDKTGLPDPVVLTFYFSVSFSRSSNSSSCSTRLRPSLSNCPDRA